MALLGEVVAPVARFMSLIARRDYDAAVAMGRRMPDGFIDGLTSLYGDQLDDVGEMPGDGWKDLWVQGPISTPDGELVVVDAPVLDKAGQDMDWFFKFTLYPGHGAEWRIDDVDASN